MRIKYYIWIALALALTLNVFIAEAAVTTDDPEARAVMQKVDDRDDGDNQTANMEMVLIDKKGQK